MRALSEVVGQSLGQSSVQRTDYVRGDLSNQRGGGW